jgi:succinate dehydrogenase/fumarate reductase cytochrome b subunit
MAVELVYRFIIVVVVRRFHGMRVLFICFDKYVRMKEFVCRSTYTCIGNSCIAFPWFFIGLWDIINFDML